VPDRADIELVSVTLASSKLDGRSWDDVALADKLLALAEPSATVLAASEPLTAGLLAAGTEALRKHISRAALPDAAGTATLVSDEGVRVVALRKQPNTFEPEFRAAWRDVKLSRGTTIRLELHDADVWRSDSIGAVELTYGDLAKAARSRGLSQIPVADRERNLRSVGLLVRGAAKKQ
jgi:hypothetical protein